MKQDANQILREQGPDALRSVIDKAVPFKGAAAAPAGDIPKLPFVMYGDLEVASSKSWLVHNMLGAGEMSAFYGPPGCGKGVIIEDMALHIAAGLDWHCRPTTRGTVLYIALERKKLVERRAIAFREKHGLRDLPFAIAGGVYDFRLPATADQITAICAQVKEATGLPVVLIIIDTISRAMAGGDENSPKDMGALVMTAGLIQQKCSEAHIAWVHHIPHDSDRLRGHGAMLGAVDTTISVSSGGLVRTAKVVKANDSEEGESVTFTIEGIQIAPDGSTAPIAVPADRIGNPAPTAREPKLTANQKTLFTMLHNAGKLGLLTEDWNAMARTAGIGCHRRADLTDIRNALKSKGLIRETGDRWTVDHSCSG